MENNLLWKLQPTHDGKLPKNYSNQKKRQRQVVAIWPPSLMLKPKLLVPSPPDRQCIVLFDSHLPLLIIPWTNLQDFRRLSVSYTSYKPTQRDNIVGIMNFSFFNPLTTQLTVRANRLSFRANWLQANWHRANWHLANWLWANWHQAKRLQFAKTILWNGIQLYFYLLV